MVRKTLLISVMLVNCHPGLAQTLPIAEVFGGYSHLWQTTTNALGWIASGAIATNRWFGLVGDLRRRKLINCTNYV
ncbi:MAG: hypothetical protein FJW26_22155 [Acidimicrobiia bacterium]|nr:hypothetical protein [Acidimicrobiia bacterium]